MERVARRWQWLSIAGVVAFGALLTSVVLRWQTVLPPEPLPDYAEPGADAAAVSDSTPSEPTNNAERAKLEELRAMSETFRNTTFLIAIRDAGYRCSELVNVYGGIGDSTTWTAACREMLAYTVRVNHAGTLHVEPTMQYSDGLVPTRDSGPSVPQPAPPPR